MNKTKVIALNSLFAAMCVVIMALGSVFETLDITLAVISGVIVAVSETEFGRKNAFLVFAVSGILAFLLPGKTPALFFVLLPGWYPIVQPKINLLSPIKARIVKTVIINVAIALSIVAAKLIFLAELPTYMLVLFFVLGNITFYLYDILLSRLVLWYIVKLRKRLGFK